MVTADIPLTPGQIEKAALQAAEQKIFSSDNAIIQKLIGLDRAVWKGLPFSELLIRLEAVESPRSRDSLLRAITDRLLMHELTAHQTIALAGELRAGGFLPEPLEAMPAVERALDRARDW